MEHLIRFRTAEGIEGMHVAPGLDDAVTFVERLRNAEGATDVKLYRLAEVAIEFRPYYRVEVGGVEAAPEPTVPVTSPLPAHVGSPPQHVVADPPSLVPYAEHVAVPRADHADTATPELPDLSPANGRRLFSRT